MSLLKAYAVVPGDPSTASFGGGVSSARCMLLLEPQRQDSALISCMAADYAAATSFMPMEPGTTG